MANPAFGDPTPADSGAGTSAVPAMLVASGQITDAMGGGIAEAEVRLFHQDDWPDGEPIGSTATDALGDFALRLDAAPTGTLVMVITKSRYQELVHTFEVRSGGSPEYLGATLEGDLTLSGRVVDKLTGAAVVGASVRRNSMSGKRSVQTDDDGRFRFQAVAPGPAEVTVQADGFGRERRTFDKVEDLANDVNFELKPQRTAEIAVVDDLGQPIRGVLVEVHDRPRDHFQSVTSNEQGLVTLTALHFDARTLHVRLTHEAHVCSTAFDRQITLPDDELRSMHTLMLQRAGSIRGRVVGASTGQPVHGARVVIGEEYTDDSPRAWSDADGAFVLRGVAPGSVTVTVHAADFAPDLQTASVQIDRPTELRFALSAPVQVSGVVRDRGGAPLERAEVVAMRWRGAMTLSLRALTDAQGRFLLRDAPSDSFEIAVLAPGHVVMRHRVDAPGAEPLELTLDPLPKPGEGGRPKRLRPGDDAPTFQVTTLDGEKVDSAGLRGKYVILDFWATWCPPCIDELPFLAKLQQQYGGRGDFKIIGISRDFSESDLRQFLRRNPSFAAWPHAVGRENGVEETRHAYGVGGLPQVFIIGPDGKFIDHGLRGERLIAQIEKIMKSADASGVKDTP